MLVLRDDDILAAPRVWAVVDYLAPPTLVYEGVGPITRGPADGLDLVLSYWAAGSPEPGNEDSSRA